jgi:hypothetical protein
MMYQLTIRIPFEAMDDIEARQKANALIEQGLVQTELHTLSLPSQTVLKLQRLEANKPPVGMSLTAAPEAQKDDTTNTTGV